MTQDKKQEDLLLTEKLPEDIAEILRRDMSVRVKDTIHGAEREYFFPQAVEKICEYIKTQLAKADPLIRADEREKIKTLLDDCIKFYGGNYGYVSRDCLTAIDEALKRGELK